jgi:hypothetical protein
MNEETNSKDHTDAEQQLLPFIPSLEERPAAEPSDVDILRARNAELYERLRQLEVRDEVTLALRSAGARSPELVFEAAKGSLQFGGDGSVENSEAVVAQMKQKFPEQFGTAIPPSIDGGAGQAVLPSALTKEALAKMKPDEIARLDWNVIKEALSS